MSWRWVFLMAWRDSRKNRSRLFLFISSIIVGIASLVALNSFNENLKGDIDQQAAQLIGADLVLESRRLPTPEAFKLIDSLEKISEATSTEQRFVSMIRFPKSNDTRLVQVRAIAGGYPFYGQVETSPKEAYTDFEGQPILLVDQTLLLQFHAAIGDSTQLGRKSFAIGGSLLSQPGQTALRASMVPSVWVPLDQLENSGLRQTGSRIEYFYYFKFPTGVKVDEMIGEMEDQLSLLQLRKNTISTTKENTGRAFADMASFMELTGFVALLLGCIGVSSAVHIFVREKMVSVSILRCLGANARQTFFIFLVQFAGIGLIGGLIGALIGTFIQYFIPLVMQDLVPVALSNAISWSAIAKGIALGVIIAILFALLPLIAVRHISPLNTLRVSDQTTSLWKDRLRWLIYLLIIGFIVAFARFQLQDWSRTFFFTLGIGITFAILYFVAKGVSFIVKKYIPNNLSYVWRQGLSNLYRPNNQTVVLLISIGFGTALIATLFFVQAMLMGGLKSASSDSQANVLLFDIQPSQREAVIQVTKDMGFPLVEDVPIVTMQITSINGKKHADVLQDSSSVYSGRAFRSEIRATYRDTLSASERITEGKFVGTVKDGVPAQVSVDQNYANEIGVEVGDQLIFNVQGVPVPAVVSSFREVDWNRFQSNFRIVFAKGTIDQAPQFYLIMTKIDDQLKSLKYQQAIVKQFPNVAIMNMNSMLAVLSDILDKIGFVIQFIGGFSIFTGVIVLISSVRISKYQRIRENVLLRTLGASRRQILYINFSEYLFLGVLASIVGLLIALLASNLLAVFMFKSTFLPSLVIVILLIISVSVLTVLIGMLNSRSVLNQPPLKVLRRD